MCYQGGQNNFFELTFWDNIDHVHWKIYYLTLAVVYGSPVAKVTDVAGLPAGVTLAVQTLSGYGVTLVWALATEAR